MKTEFKNAKRNKIKAHHNFISWAFENDLQVYVDDGDGELIQQKGFKEAVDACEAVCSSSITIADKDNPRPEGGFRMGVAYVMNDRSFDPEEYIYNYSVTPYMDAWASQYSDLID